MEERQKKVKSILVTLPEPENGKSPYYDLAKKYALKLDFRSFIHVEGVAAKDFRKEKIYLSEFTAVIFTSKNAVDHFFRICKEMRHEITPDLKYFCISEAIANYLSKYNIRLKRKIFVGKQTTADLADVLKKHQSEKFLYPCSDVAAEETQKFLQENGYNFKSAVLFRTVYSDLFDLAEVFYDIIVFYSPSSIHSMFHSFPDFKQNNTRIAAFGPSTHKAVAEHHLILDIAAPAKDVPSMTMAIEQYIKQANAK